MRGVIWSQGETNAPRAARDALAFPRLIRIGLAQTCGRPMPLGSPTCKASRARADGRFELTVADVAGGLATRGAGLPASPWRSDL